MEKKTPIWAAIALALGFTGGNIAGTLDTGEAIEAKPIYGGAVSWSLAYSNDQAVLRIKNNSELGFPSYLGKSPISLDPALVKEIQSLAPGKFAGAVITTDRSVVRVGDQFLQSKKTAPKTVAFVSKNLPKWCKEKSGLCEPVRVKL